MSYKFCEFTPKEKNELIKIFQAAFKVTDTDEIFNIYNAFRDNFYGTSNPQRIEGIDRKIMFPKTDQKEILEKFFDSNYQIGIDLPVFIKPIINSEKSILIIAEDPLRDANTQYPDIIVSTPFGTHLECLREKKLKHYWGITKALLDMGYNIYITDIKKVWIKNQYQKKVAVKGDFLQNFNRSLELELALIDPELIITYGNEAYKSLLELNIFKKQKHVHFPHPTGTANAAWKKLFANYYPGQSVRCFYDKKKDHILNVIKEMIPDSPSLSQE